MIGNCHCKWTNKGVWYKGDSMHTYLHDNINILGQSFQDNLANFIHSLPNTNYDVRLREGLWQRTWPFLENVMRALGLPQKWRNCTSALYRTATSSVLMAGSRGPAFQLQRSVRQGCPLAPYLYLFVTEAFSTYLQAPSNGLRGLPIPNATEDLLLSECADDTVLFL